MKKQTQESIGVKGFYRLQITEDKNGTPKVVGDSGWRQNQITNLGFNQYLVGSLGSVSGMTSKTVTHVGLGTGGVPAASDTSLAGESETSKRASVTANSSSNSKAVQFTATFSSSDNFVTATKNISNIGLFGGTNSTLASATGSQTLFAGNTYASSSVATNQNVNVTYTINFA